MLTSSSVVSASLRVEQSSHAYEARIAALATEFVAAHEQDARVGPILDSATDYALWEKAGQPDGAHDQHWQQACRKIEGGNGTTIPDTTPAAETCPAMTIHLTAEADAQGCPPHPGTTERR